MTNTNVISEQRKTARANLGVKRFFQQIIEQDVRGYIRVNHQRNNLEETRISQDSPGFLF